MSRTLIDAEGYRPNVGIILCNAQNEVLWARRIGQNAWQFPQGGIKKGEQPEQALYRELKEEIGLDASQVSLLAKTSGWLKYRLPEHLIRFDSKPICYGQKQIWYLLQILVEDVQIALDACKNPEFDHWKWVNYWYPLQEVVAFKREVYKQALQQLQACLNLNKTAFSNKSK